MHTAASISNNNYKINAQRNKLKKYLYNIVNYVVPFNTNVFGKLVGLGRHVSLVRYVETVSCILKLPIVFLKSRAIRPDPCI